MTQHPGQTPILDAALEALAELVAEHVGLQDTGGIALARDVLERAAKIRANRVLVEIIKAE